jgi:hypothetical protein
MVIASLLADLLVALHLAFVVFVVAGGLLVLRWPRLAWVHVPAAVWGALVEVTGWICPLTPVENCNARFSKPSSRSFFTLPPGSVDSSIITSRPASSARCTNH